MSRRPGSEVNTPTRPGAVPFIGNSSSAASCAMLKASGVNESNTMAVVGGCSSLSGGVSPGGVVPGAVDTVVRPGVRRLTWMPMPLALATTEKDPIVCATSFS